jgi:hypothetical protein
MDQGLKTTLTPVPQVLRVKCHYCSRFRSPHEILKIGTGGAIMCWFCYEWHGKALKMLCGALPMACQGDNCGVTWEQLQERGDSKMYVHNKDGIYQILCQSCSDRHVLLRADLYRPTRYGHQLKL